MDVGRSASAVRRLLAVHELQKLGRGPVLQQLHGDHEQTNLPVCTLHILNADLQLT